MAQTSDQSHGPIDISKLPSLPQTLIELIDLCNNPDRDLKKIASLVAADASISARVLQLANSAFIGARNKFSDIEQAVIYLGVDTVRNLAISVSVHETFGNIKSSDVINIASFWYHSFLTAVLSKALAQSVNYPDPAEAYLTGLLHDVGKLLLFTSFPDRYPDLLEQEWCGNMLPVFERAELGITHAEASSLLVSQWNLEQHVTDAIFNHHESEDDSEQLAALGKILYFANRLSNTMLISPDSMDDLPETMLNIPADKLSQIISNGREEVDEITTEMGITASAEPLAIQEPSKKDFTQQVDLTRKVEAISTIGGVVDNLLKAENLNRVVRIIEESFHILFNIRHCLLLLPDADSGAMEIHVSSNNSHHDHDELLIPVSLGEQGMLSECASKGKIQYVFQGNHLLLNTIEIQCLRLLNADGLIAVPVPLENSSMGILVVGVGEVEAEAILEQKETISQLAGQVGMRIRLERLQQKATADQITTLTRVARQIAMEITGPVTSLENRLAFLATILDSQPDLKDLLDIMNKDIKHIAQITNQLNDLSSSEDTEKLSDVDVNEIIRKIADFHLHSLPPDNETEIKLDLSIDIPIIRTSAAGVRQIAGNIIKNSLEALKKSGKLSVRTALQTGKSNDERYLQIIIEDDGPGTPPEMGENIFAAGVTSKGSGHPGLGLAISRKLVHDLGGTISYSSGQQAGTRFTISFPLVSES